MFTLLLLLAHSATTTGVLRFAHSYGSHMVLQSTPHQALVWGYTSSPDANVTLTISPKPINSSGQVAAEVSGSVWRAGLPAIAASHTPYTLTIAEGSDTAAISDVLFGDVWLCSGQSNMAFLLEMDMNGTALVEDAERWPNIRLFTSKKISSDAPLAEQTAVEQPWVRGSSKAVSDDGKGLGDDNWLYMSAVCWLYGREIQKETSLPVGLVNTNWGGTSVEQWSTTESRAVCPKPGKAGGLYNGMIHPLLNMTIRGAIWFQGEANGGDKFDFHGGPTGKQLLTSYACRFPSMIADWRAKWHAGTGGRTDPLFPFGFVQLGADTSHFSKAYTRWSQTAGYGYVPNKAMPNTFMAVAMDLEDLESPYNAVHFRWKQEVGRRLGLAGRAVAYGAKVEWKGPLVDHATRSDTTIALTFDQEIVLSEVNNITTWELCRSIPCPMNSSLGWEVASARATSSTVTLRGSGVVGVGVGFCQNYKELSPTFSPEICYASLRADAECEQGKAASMSIGMPGGKRAGRCLCGLAPTCGTIEGTTMGKDGWDRYSPSTSQPVVAVRYAWRDVPCMHLQCGVYGPKENLPAPPFVLELS